MTTTNKGRFLPTFPANVFGSGPSVVTKSGLSYTFSFDLRILTAENSSVATSSLTLVQDPTTGAFAKITLANLLANNQPLDPTLTALAGLDSTAGLLEQTGANAFTKRPIGAAADNNIPTRLDADNRYFQKTDTVPATAGGTGFASYVIGDLIFADTTTTLAKLAGVATGNALISGGVGTAPAWGKIGLTTHVSGTLGVANGGIGVTTLTEYAVICGGTSAAGPVQSVASVGSAGQVLTSNGAAALPTFQTPSTSPAVGQCRLVKSGSDIVLQPFNGNLLAINGTNQAIPSAGVSLAPSGLSVGTLYYIYAYMNAGVMTLEASTTARATDTTTGVQIKSGDATRTLVGLARPTTGPAFTDSATQRFVISWFNRRALATENRFTANRTITATSSAEVNSEIRCEFLTWSDVPVRVQTAGSWAVTGAAVGYASQNFDGSTTAYCRSSTSSATSTSISLFDEDALSEGYHYATLFGFRTGGTNVLFEGTADGGVSLQATVQG